MVWMRLYRLIQVGSSVLCTFDALATIMEKMLTRILCLILGGKVILSSHTLLIQVMLSEALADLPQHLLMGAGKDCDENENLFFLLN